MSNFLQSTVGAHHANTRNCMWKKSGAMRAMTKFTHFICKEIIGFLWASRTIWRCSILNGQRGRRPMENRTVTRPSFSLCCICCSGEARASTEGNYQTACKKISWPSTSVHKSASPHKKKQISCAGENLKSAKWQRVKLLGQSNCETRAVIVKLIDMVAVGAKHPPEYTSSSPVALTIIGRIRHVYGYSTWSQTKASRRARNRR